MTTARSIRDKTGKNEEEPAACPPRARPAHAILQAIVDEDLPDLERAVRALADSLSDEDPPRDSSHT
jgi:hypothetical protein